jgi:hypothetical protein
MTNENTNPMRLLFSQEELSKQVAVSEAMRAEVNRLIAMTNKAILSARAAASITLPAITPEMIEGLGLQLRPLLAALAEDRRQHALVLSLFAKPKLRLRPHPAARRLIDQLRRDVRAQTQPLELDTIA